MMKYPKVAKAKKAKSKGVMKKKVAKSPLNNTEKLGQAMKKLTSRKPNGKY